MGQGRVLATSGRQGRTRLLEHEQHTYSFVVCHLRRRPPQLEPHKNRQAHFMLAMEAKSAHKGGDHWLES